ncbi:MAG: VWA domain-containing protein [Deltaproteobacteria bacterium]|nr:VWA domain-containing protein [Deltaproteobacteria bacterium]
MQRTAVIYGLALSTLVGVFLLAPRLVAPPKPPEPVVAPRSAAPITKLVYGDGVLEVTATLDRGHLAGGSLEPVWMDVAIKAAGMQTRAPLAAVLVIDRSGSMAGDKIDDARQAAERFVQGMVDGDMLSVVTYGSDVTVDLPFTTLDSASKSRALGIVRRIEEGGGTNIDGGMLAAKSQIANANTSGKVTRVVMISDGRPTEGDRRTATLTGHSTSLRSQGVTVSTVGLGLDYNEDLMEQMAVDGGGRYHYMKTGAQMAQILDAELQHGRNVVAGGVKLHLPRSLAAGLRVEGAPGQKDLGNSDKLVVDVGDLAAGEERHVLVKIDVATAADVGFAAPELIYNKAGQTGQSLVAQRADAFRLLPTTDLAMLNSSRNDDVRVRVLQIEASLALTASMNQWSQGDSAGARQNLMKAKADVAEAAKRTGNAMLMREAKNFDDVLDSVAASPAPASSAAGLDVVKAQKARAFDLRR